MKAYPIVLTPADEGGYTVYVPDFDINTQGDDIGDALFMARDAISMTGVYNEDRGLSIPEPTNFDDVSKNADPKDKVLMVDVDFSGYRKKMDNKAVRKNCTIPSWLNDAAEKNSINFSAVLQEALKKELGM